MGLSGPLSALRRRPQRSRSRWGCELPAGRIGDETAPFARALNDATETANAVVPEAYEKCKKQHEDLAQRLGLARSKTEF